MEPWTRTIRIVTFFFSHKCVSFFTPDHFLPCTCYLIHDYPFPGSSPNFFWGGLAAGVGPLATPPAVTLRSYPSLVTPGMQPHLGLPLNRTLQSIRFRSKSWLSNPAHRESRIFTHWTRSLPLSSTFFSLSVFSYFLCPSLSPTRCFQEELSDLSLLGH